MRMSPSIRTERDPLGAHNQDGITAIVVTYNSSKTIAACISALLEHGPENLEVIVVDNASSDGTRSIVRGFDERVCLLENPLNLGYGHANNVGVGASGRSILLFVNPDAVVTRLDGHALEVLLRDEGLGAVGLSLTAGNGREYFFRKPFPPFWLGAFSLSLGLLRLSDDNDMRLQTALSAPGWVSGALFAMRRDIFLSVGGFDERFFLYLEDVDICRRLYRAGLSVATDGCASARHGPPAAEDRDLEHSVRPWLATRVGWNVSGWLTYVRKWRGLSHARLVFFVYLCVTTGLAFSLSVTSALSDPSGRMGARAREYRQILRICLRAASAPTWDARQPQPEARIAMALSKHVDS